MYYLFVMKGDAFLIFFFYKCNAMQSGFNQTAKPKQDFHWSQIKYTSPKQKKNALLCPWNRPIIGASCVHYTAEPPIRNQSRINCRGVECCYFFCVVRFSPHSICVKTRGGINRPEHCFVFAHWSCESELELELSIWIYHLASLAPLVTDYLKKCCGIMCHPVWCLRARWAATLVPWVCHVVNNLYYEILRLTALPSGM